MINRIGVALVLLATVLFVVSCSKFPKDLLGKWHNETDKKETILFMKDGVLAVIEGKETFAGSYALVDKRTVKIDVGGLRDSQVATYEFDKDGYLVFTLPNGHAEKFKRVE